MSRTAAVALAVLVAGCVTTACGDRRDGNVYDHDSTDRRHGVHHH